MITPISGIFRISPVNVDSLSFNAFEHIELFKQIREYGDPACFKFEHPDKKNEFFMVFDIMITRAISGKIISRDDKVKEFKKYFQVVGESIPPMDCYPFFKSYNQWVEKSYPGRNEVKISDIYIKSILNDIFAT